MFATAVAAADRLRTQFSDAGVTINSNSSLAKLIDDSIRFAQNPLAEVSNEKGVVRAMLRGQYVDRIASAAGVLRGHNDAKQHLWALKKDALDPGGQGSIQSERQALGAGAALYLEGQGGACGDNASRIWL